MPARDGTRAVCLAGTVAATGSRIRATVKPDWQTDLEHHIVRARHALGDEAAAAAWAEGQAMTLEQAIAFGLEEDGT